MDSGRVLGFLKQISIATQDNASESNFDATLTTLMDETSLILQSDCLSMEQKSQVMIEVFRFLRNFVASSEPRQSAVARHASFGNILNWITKLTTTLCDAPEKQNSSSCPGELLQLRCAVQFLGNLITGNIDNKLALWKNVVSLFSLWMRSEDEALKNYTSMVLYNAILGVSSHREQLMSSKDSEIITISLLASTNTGCEWALFVLENFLESAHFVESCYLCIPKKLRVSLLDILCLKLSRDTCPSIPFETLEFVMKEFQLKSDMILLNSDRFTDDDLDFIARENDCLLIFKDPLLFVKYLEILCEASTKSSYQERIQKSSSLLCSLVYLLKSNHLANKNSSNGSAEKQKFTLDPVSEPGQESGNCQASHFKKHLIRLIANLCWKHLDNQDKVREMEGIPLLLDCCKLDPQNPFIIEWVIFAIHNLCEGNTNNQEVIDKMKPQNALKPTVLTGLGTPSDDSYNASSVMSGTSRLEQIRDDIRDIMQ